MEGIFFIFTLQCLVLSFTEALQVTIPQPSYEHARGDNITLPCNFVPKNPDNPLVIIVWTSEGDKPGAAESLVLTHYSTTKQTDIPPKYEGRVSLDYNIAQGKANLKISSITLADNKVFECRIQIPKDDEGKLAATTRLVVLVAPSTPICKIQGKSEYGQNINLTCASEEGSPAPTYKWDVRDVRNMPRPRDPRTTDKGGILSLYNLTIDTSGYYTCTSSNKIRSATCNVTLTVLPPSMNIGSTAGIIGGVVAALIVLILIIYCCCCRKKKGKEEEYVMGVAEDGEFRDKEPVKNGERQEDVRSDYDDRSVRSPSDRRDDREYDRDYDDRRSDYDDRRSDYDDRRDDRRYDRHYDDDRRYDERRDRQYDDDRYDEPYDDRDSGRAPSVPSNKPSRMDYDD